MLHNDNGSVTRESMVTEKKYSTTSNLAKEGFETAMSKKIQSLK